mgnify:CR=1 FL=1
MNNCVVRTVLSCVLGGGMGVMFGIFMGTMDTVGAAAGLLGLRVLCCAAGGLPVCVGVAGCIVSNALGGSGVWGGLQACAGQGVHSSATHEGWLHRMLALKPLL